ncbi:hypothetical protein BRAS3843_2900035 [Bradyrhizobium sp. STM 3843]|nr:hypothetical protein BRAS3843_2900035 [Bradyrhizobium sp. STM 3843]
MRRSITHFGVAGRTHRSFIQLPDPINYFDYRMSEGIVPRDGGGLLDRPVTEVSLKSLALMRVCPMARSG